MRNTFNNDIFDILQCVVAAALNKDTSNQYTSTTSIDKMENILFNGNYDEAIKAYRNNKRLYRGDWRNENKKFAEVIPGIRKSEYTSNIYTRLFSGLLPSWEKYPPRNKSVICTNDINKATRYSAHITKNKDTVNYFVILPQNGTKIAVCPADDIWKSFKYATQTVSARFGIQELASEIPCILTTYANGQKFNERIYKRMTKMFESESDEKLLEYFIEAEENIRENYSESYLDRYKKHERDIYYFVVKAVLKGTGIIEFFNNLLSPNKNGFSLVNVNKIPTIDSDSCEMWFSAKYLMIRNDVIDELLK